MCDSTCFIRGLKEKHFSELLQLWEIALERGGSREQTVNELPKILIEEKKKQILKISGREKY